MSAPSDTEAKRELKELLSAIETSDLDVDVTVQQKLIKKDIYDIDAFIDDPYLGFIKNKLVPDPNGLLGSLELESEVTSYHDV